MVFSLLASALIAQVSTSDYACWADFGNGIVDMSYMCGDAQTATPTIQVRPVSSSLSNVSTNPFNTLIPLPKPEVCENDCIAALTPAATYTSPSGRLEIVQPIIGGDFWVRVPRSYYGYGPFTTRSQAYEFAKANFNQFFNANTSSIR